MNTALYETYVQILHEELVPAMGCTEPIAVAYAGALARPTPMSSALQLILCVGFMLFLRKKGMLDDKKI